MNDFRFGVSPVNYPDPDPVRTSEKIIQCFSHKYFQDAANDFVDPLGLSFTKSLAT